MTKTKLTIHWGATVPPGFTDGDEQHRTARDARRRLLDAADAAGARVEGNGKAGSLVAGKGSSKRRLAIYEMGQ